MIANVRDQPLREVAISTDYFSGSDGPKGPIPPGANQTIEIDLRSDASIDAAAVAGAAFIDGVRLQADAAKYVRIVSQHRAAAATFWGRLRNASSVPIEAFGIAYVNADGTVSGEHVSDYCLSDPSPSRAGSGRIGPETTREISPGIGSGFYDGHEGRLAR